MEPRRRWPLRLVRCVLRRRCGFVRRLRLAGRTGRSGAAAAQPSPLPAAPAARPPPLRSASALRPRRRPVEAARPNLRRFRPLRRRDRRRCGRLRALRPRRRAGRSGARRRPTFAASGLSGGETAAVAVGFGLSAAGPEPVEAGAWAVAIGAPSGPILSAGARAAARLGSDGRNIGGGNSRPKEARFGASASAAS